MVRLSTLSTAMQVSQGVVASPPCTADHPPTLTTDTAQSLILSANRET